VNEIVKFFLQTRFYDLKNKNVLKRFNSAEISLMKFESVYKISKNDTYWVFWKI